MSHCFAGEPVNTDYIKHGAEQPMMNLTSVERLLQRDNLYPDFIKYLKQTATRTLSPGSLWNRLAVMETLKRSYDLKVEAPDVPSIVAKFERADLSTATMNNYKWVLLKWMAFREIPISKDDELLLQRKYGGGKRKREIMAGHGVGATARWTWQ